MKDVSTGKHMICDLRNIRNTDRLESIASLQSFLDSLCKKYDFTILGKLNHQFCPQGSSVLYMLSESHISIHTFPEKQYLALDIYTCRDYSDNSIYLQIYDEMVEWFQCDRGGGPLIVNRGQEPDCKDSRIGVNRPA